MNLSHKAILMKIFTIPNKQSAIKDENWVQAMDEEIETIEKNNTWDLVDFLKEKKSHCCKMGLQDKVEWERRNWHT